MQRSCRASQYTGGEVRSSVESGIAPSHDRVEKLSTKQAVERLGRTLRSARESRGLTQKQVAAEAGLSVRCYSCLERGRDPAGGHANPTLDTILRVMRALSLSPFDLAGET
jgi:DNA-binding XRE family transcriptional regulator